MGENIKAPNIPKPNLFFSFSHFAIFFYFSHFANLVFLVLFTPKSKCINLDSTVFHIHLIQKICFNTEMGIIFFFVYHIPITGTLHKENEIQDSTKTLWSFKPFSKDKPFHKLN